MPADDHRKELKMIAALYVETDGAYFGLPGVEPWDEAKGLSSVVFAATN